VPQDFDEAVLWYEKSAAQDFYEAQTLLANMYAKGLGTAKDYDKAVSLYRAAAQVPDPAAQYGLGVLSERGWGLPKDEAKALEWYQKAAHNGYAPASAQIARLSGK
jgi:TPR repeat protein